MCSDDETQSGQRVVKFGKHEGKTFDYIFRRCKSYANWVLGLSRPFGQMRSLKAYFEAQSKKASSRKRKQRTSSDTLESKRKKRRRSRSRPSKAEIEASKNDFQEFLKAKFVEHQEAYPNLTFECLPKGYDPFAKIIEQHGTSWMKSIRHQNYRNLPASHWNPKRILEWGQTFCDVYMESASRKSIEMQKVVIQLMFGWCCFVVTPDMERRIYRRLQNKYMTHCHNIKKTFGLIFTTFEERMKGKAVPDIPPSVPKKVPLKEFFGDQFLWSMAWPVEYNIRIACKYYMWRRSDGDFKAEESAAASDRRTLLIQMLQTLEKDKTLTSSSNDDGSDKLYYTQGGKVAILVKVPDEKAVHVFRQPDGCESVKFHARVFALFRHFSTSIMHPMITKVGETPAYARIGDDPDNLPEVWVMRKCQGRPGKFEQKLSRNLEALEAYPGMLHDLAPDDSISKQKTERPTLKDYVGWQYKRTHQKEKLSKAVFVEALGMPEKFVKKLERRTVKEITRARKKLGSSGKRKFSGGSWKQTMKKIKRKKGEHGSCESQAVLQA